MILYTAMPLEAVLEGMESYRPEHLELDHPRGKIIVERISPTQARVVRLISPCPQDYLDPKTQPGTIISLMP